FASASASTDVAIASPLRCFMVCAPLCCVRRVMEMRRRPRWQGGCQAALPSQVHKGEWVERDRRRAPEEILARNSKLPYALGKRRGATTEVAALPPFLPGVRPRRHVVFELDRRREGVPLALHHLQNLFQGCIASTPSHVARAVGRCGAILQVHARNPIVEL